MIWLPSSPDLNPIENLWEIIKQKVYANGHQYKSKLILGEAINTASRAIPPATTKKLTDSISTRHFDVIQFHDVQVGK